MATTDKNNLLKNFTKKFERLAFKQGYSTVFDDYLDCFINGFSFEYKSHQDYLKSRYSIDERKLFTLMIYDTIQIINKELVTNDWYDFFGTFYEQASMTKKKGFSQYFTPVPVCEFMAKIVDPVKSEMMTDPACGSARMTLSSNSVCPGNFYFLVDLDYTCAKMAALNLMLHGIQGVVVCDNGLFPGKNFRGGFIINATIYETKVPQIHYTDNVNYAYNYVRKITNRKKKKSISEEIINILKNEDENSTLYKRETESYSDIKEVIAENLIDKNGQISLF